MSQPIRIAVVGCGAFGQNHLRVLKELPEVELVGAVDSDAGKLSAATTKFGCRGFSQASDLVGKVDAAVIAIPTTAHAEVGCLLMRAGIDVLIEKPIAPDLLQAQSLVDTAVSAGRVLQVGHLERFNPAVTAVTQAATVPLFFEVHRLSIFTPRSLDVDVVLDLMIHDLDIVLSMTREMPTEVKAAGIRILSPKVDIANVRLAFASGCIANLTASRVSTEKIRKLRLFQPNEYLSIDYEKQAAMGVSVGANQQIGFKPFPISKQEPLMLELQHFVDCVTKRNKPLVSGTEAIQALQLALQINQEIEQHTEIVKATLAAQ
jgi:predicted dehydrogenase